MSTTQHRAQGSDGAEHIIYEIRSTIRTTTLSSSVQEHVSGLPMYTLKGGVRVNKIDERTFRTSDGHLTLTLL